MDELRSTLTELGKMEIKNAIANETLVTWDKIAVGDGGGEEIFPHSGMTQLVNQMWVGGLISREIDYQDPQKVTFHATIPNQIMGFTIREVGILNQDGQLMAVSRSNMIDKNMGDVSGGYIDVDIYFSVIVQDARCIEIIAEQNVEIATRESVQRVGDRVTDLEQRATSADDDRKAIHDEITVINNNIEVIHNDISNLQGDIDNLASEFAEYKEYIMKDYEKRIKALEDALEGVDKLLEIV